MTARLESTTRPNGKVYRPRRPLRLNEYEGYYGTGVVVFGTHNVFHAGLFAARWIAERDLNPTNVELNWVRLVPWDASGEFDRSFIEDTTRGTPVVMWEAS